MEYVLTAAEMKQCDEQTTTEYGIPSLVLMERVALETARIITGRYGTDISVGIVAGSGNNGGDGIAIARILQESGVSVQIHLMGEEAKCTEQTRMQIRAARMLDIPIHYGMDNYLYDVIVDAIFGIGISREIEGKYKEVIEGINESHAIVVSADMPSGIHTDSGRVMGCAIEADITVTYGYRKLGQLLYPGTDYTGELICVPIGIPDKLVENTKKGIVTFTKSDLRFPKRNHGGNKGTFGKVLMIAGSKNMGGACQLASTSAFRIGSGMVRIYTAWDNRESLLRKLPEAIIDTYADDEQEGLSEEETDRLQKGISWADVIAIGPGLSTSAKAGTILSYVLEHSEKPMVIDADALNILAQKQDLLQMLEHGRNPVRREIILTPHLGEFARLLQHPVSEISQNILKYCRSFTQKYDVTLVCKDARTIVTRKLKMTYLNTSGNDGMATAGSGDVLTGMIAGLLAQKMDSYEAAVMGTFIHGLAGDIAKERSSAYYIMSQDIIWSLKYLTEEYKEADNS